MKSIRLSAGGVNVYLQYAIQDLGEPGDLNGNTKAYPLISVYERSKETVYGFWANAHKTIMRERGGVFATPTQEGVPYISNFCSISYGKEGAWGAYLYNPMLKKKTFLCRKDRIYDDFFSYVMENFKLPFLKEWSKPLLDLWVAKGLANIGHTVIGLMEGEEDKIKIDLRGNGGIVSLSEIEVVRLSVGVVQQTVIESLQELHRTGEVFIAHTPQEPITVKTLDEYLQEYGQSVVDNMKKVIKPLTGLNGNVDNVALKRLRLYPQQVAIVNGAQAALKKHNFVFMNEGMGTGKTIQSLSVIDGIENQKWLDRHPGSTLSDCFSGSSNVAYRAIVMAPAHLVKKWASEIKNNIPYAKVYTLEQFSDVLAIRERPRKATEKEFYVIGKDFAKLSYMQRPIPTKIGVRPQGKYVCAECGREKEYRGSTPCICGCNKWELQSRYICSKCGKVRTYEDGPCECGGNWQKKPLSMRPKMISGLICPSCDNIIWPYTNWNSEKSSEELRPLLPEDFDRMKQYNSKCYVCGEPLWEPKIANIGDTEKQSKWINMKHYNNAKKNSTSTSWVYKGREQNFEEVTGKKLICDAADRRSRKYSPATFIKKHLKGWFDYAVFDECHLFKGGATAQGNAMEALVKASKKQLLLTGTLLNGYANAIFYILYRVAPGLMKRHGFTWDDEMQFAQQYGVVISKYEFDEGAYNKSSRGKQIGSPRVKPGISPMIIVDFLLPYQLTLDLSDMSKFLPPLKEEVVVVPPNERVIQSYKGTISDLNVQAYTLSGSKSGSDKLQFALSYPDKPYGRKNIISSVDGSTLARVDNYPEFVENGGLLPKEEKLVELVKSELAEGRNSVIFAEYTNSAETIISERIKYVLEENIPELDGKVCIIESGHPKAVKREEWMHEKAREGVKVFITNPRNVETGLDFVWTETDTWGITTKYNYPTLIYFQIGYNLFTLWQSSRRHYRLCQTEECRTYYLAYSGTIQMDVLQIMAEKQTATAAIQGKFSAEGLAKMSKQVDARVKLAQALQSNTKVDEESLVNMFDVLNHSNNSTSETEEEVMADYKPMPIFEEVVGALAIASDEINSEVNNVHDEEVITDYSDDNYNNFLEMGEAFGWFMPKEKKAVDKITADNLDKTLGETSNKHKITGQTDLLSLLFN